MSRAVVHSVNYTDDAFRTFVKGESDPGYIEAIMERIADGRRVEGRRHHAPVVMQREGVSDVLSRLIAIRAGTQVIELLHQVGRARILDLKRVKICMAPSVQLKVNIITLELCRQSRKGKELRNCARQPGPRDRFAAGSVSDGVRPLSRRNILDECTYLWACSEGDGDALRSHAAPPSGG